MRPEAAAHQRAAPAPTPAHSVRQRHQPVEKNRLLKAHLEVVVRCQPVAALEHLASGFRVECLVGISDRRAAEAGEEREHREDDNEQHATTHETRLYNRGAVARAARVRTL